MENTETTPEKPPDQPPAPPQKKDLGGRPLVKISRDNVFKLAVMGCTNKEIAFFFNVSDTTIGRRFGKVLKKAREECKTSLRQWMWNKAKEGNTTMQIFLSKQWLGYADKTDHTSNGGSVRPLQITVTTAKAAEDLTKAIQHITDTKKAEKPQPTVGVNENEDNSGI